MRTGRYNTPGLALATALTEAIGLPEANTLLEANGLPEAPVLGEGIGLREPDASPVKKKPMGSSHHSKYFSSAVCKRDHSPVDYTSGPKNPLGIFVCSIKMLFFLINPLNTDFFLLP